MSDLVRNPEDRFSQNEAHLYRGMIDYVNMPDNTIFKTAQINNFQMKNNDIIIFFIFAQRIDCEYSSEQPHEADLKSTHTGGSKEYPQSVLSKIRQIVGTLLEGSTCFTLARDCLVYYRGPKGRLVCQLC